MVNPGAFQGSRKEFLISKKSEYREAVKGGYAADALASIQRQYLKRYPIDFPHDQEPAPEVLDAVNDDSPEQDFEAPDSSTMSKEEYTLALENLEQRRKLLLFRKAVSVYGGLFILKGSDFNFQQIKRWFAYQYIKDQDMDPKESGAQDPYRALLFKLTGVGMQRPRLKSSVNTWRKSQREEIEREVRRVVLRDGTPRSQLAKVRDIIARKLFEALPAEEQKHWGDLAKEEHEAALERWKEDTTGKTSKDPVACQQ